MLVMAGRLEIRVGDPKVDDVHKAREEDHHEQQLEPDVDLEGFEQPRTGDGEPFRREPHEDADNDLGHRQDDDPGDHLIDPMEDAPPADVDAGMHEADPVGLVGDVIQQLEAGDAQHESEGAVDDIIDGIPGTLVLQHGVAAGIVGQDGGDGHVQDVRVARPKGLLANVHEPRPEFAAGLLLLPLEVERYQRNDGQEGLDERREAVLRVEDLADFVVVGTGIGTGIIVVVGHLFLLVLPDNAFK
mmetsp:Transcript_29612/g.86258  ORF Transcript_29612/g.86258 Transcript_29612/m.86258 type:complete len:244 (+) Transcript_29612:1676-2407(+)